MEFIGLIIGLVGLPSGIYFIIRKLRKPYKLHINYEQLILSKIYCPKNNNVHDRFCIGFYVLDILNNSESAKTIKNIDLIYSYNGEKIKTEPYSVQTGTILDQTEPAVALSNSNSNIILLQWNCINKKLAKRQSLQCGEVFNGSVVYLLNKELSDVKNIKDIKMVVKDFGGRKTEIKIKIKEKELKQFKLGYRLINRKWIQRKNGDIELLQ